MGRGINFLECFMSDITLCILSLLDDPADVVRMAAVSRSWRHFVIINGLSKTLCLRKTPTLTNVTSIVEKRGRELITYSNATCWDALERDHKIYISLLYALSISTYSPKQCIECVIGASSTNQHPEESVVHTLIEGERHIWGVSYWSSTGQSDPNIPESIVFKLNSRVCIVNEIKIQPSKAFWETGKPVYSAMSVRFRMVHPRSSTDFMVDVKSLPLQQLEDKYVWTYTSPEFPMTQEYYLQSFKLPEPTVCLGGYLQIELLGRSQRNESDGLFYLCLAQVSILGHTLSPAFNIEMGVPGSISLIYSHDVVNSVLHKIFPIKEEDSDDDSGEHISLYLTPLQYQIEYLLQITIHPDQDPGHYLYYAIAYEPDFYRF